MAEPFPFALNRGIPPPAPGGPPLFTRAFPRAPFFKPIRRRAGRFCRMPFRQLGKFCQSDHLRIGSVGANHHLGHRRRARAR